MLKTTISARWQQSRTGDFYSALWMATALWVGATAPRSEGQCISAWRASDPISTIDGSIYAATTWDPDGPGPLSSLLAVGGSFTTAGGVPASNIAVWNGTAWSSTAAGTDRRVLALTSFNNKLIAGGDFTGVGGPGGDGVAQWDGVSWQPLGAGISGTVSALTVYNGELIAAGLFTSAGGMSANNIARWDGANWHPLGGGLEGSFPLVQAVAVFGGRLYAGGSFSLAGGNTAKLVAQWDGATWAPVGTGINGFGYITSMAVYDGGLLIAGQFPEAGGTDAHNIARWTGTAWQSLGRGLNSSPSAMTVFNGKLILGGNFNFVPDFSAASKIAQWDGVVWQPLGSGTNNDVLALTVYQGSLIAGGEFTVAGGNSASRCARWGPPPPTILTQPSNQSVCDGTGASFVVQASGTGIVTYQWRRGEASVSNGGNVSGADTSVLTISPAGPADANAHYNCIVSDSCGATTVSQDAALAITATPPSAEAGGPYSVCGAGTVNLNGAATSYAGVAWTSSGSGTFTNTNSVNATYTPSEADISAGSVTLTLTANAVAPCSAPAVATSTLTINQNPTVDAGGPYETCDVAPVTLSGSASHAQSVAWATSGTGVFSNAGSLNATYTPSAEDLVAENITLTLTAAPLSPCTTPASSSTNLRIQGAPTAIAGGPYYACGTAPVSLTESSSEFMGSAIWTTSGTGVFSNDRAINPLYEPSPADVAAGMVQLTLTVYPNEPCETPAVSQATVIIHDEPAISSQPAGAAIGVGSPYSLTVTATGGGLGYQWMKNGTPIPGAINPTYEINPATLADAGEYACVISNDCGTIGSESALIEVNNQATVSLRPASNCITGNQLVIEVNVSGATEMVVGGQFFFRYNTSVLQFVSASTIEAPFLRTIYLANDNSLGTIDYAVGVEQGSHGTASNTTMAQLTFNIVQDLCTPASNLVTWRHVGPFGASNLLSDYEGNQVVVNTVDPTPIKIDHTAPTLVLPADIAVQCVSDIPPPADNLGALITAGGAASDNCGQVIVDFIGDSLLSGGACGGTISRTYRATDECGNMTDSVQTITIHDTIAPQIADPGQIAPYYHALSMAEDAAKAAALAGASDNCTSSLTASASTSGTCDAVITVTVSDSCGNVSSAVQYGTQIDGTPPTITACALDESAPANSQCQASVPDFAVQIAANDDCSAPEFLSVVQSPPAGALVGPGVIPVTVTVADLAGNESVCTAQFTVVDETPPFVDACPTDIITNVNAANCSAVVSWSEPTASDNCGSATIGRTAGPSPGSSFANGSVTTIQYTATDAGNLSSVCSFTITVAASPDMNDDHTVNLLDAPIFAEVLLGTDLTAWRVARADVNCDGVANGDDIQAFVDLLLH